MDKLNLIKQVDMFQGLLDADLKSLTDIVIIRSHVKGETIFEEGDEAKGFYFVVSGRVKIFKLSPAGKEQILHLFGRGEPFGEVALFSGKYFPASAETLERSRVGYLPSDAFAGLIGRHPAIALNMIGVLSKRLRTFTNLIEQLSLREVPERLASYFLYLHSLGRGSNEIKLDVTKQQLASFIGTIPETLSRVIKKMNSGGLIDATSTRIKIIDLEGLKGLATGDRKLQ